MLAFAAEPIMEIDVAARTGAGHASRPPDRIDHRNGYRERPWGEAEDGIAGGLSATEDASPSASRHRR